MGLGGWRVSGCFASLRMTAKTTDQFQLRPGCSFQLRLVGAGGGFAGFYFFEEPDDADAEEAEEREPAEDVDEGPVGGLALEFLIQLGLCRIGGVGLAEVAGESAGHAVERVLELLAGDGDGVDDLVLMDGAAAGGEGLGGGGVGGGGGGGDGVEGGAGVCALVFVDDGLARRGV